MSRTLCKHSVLCLLGNPAPCRTPWNTLFHHWRTIMKKHTNLTINGVVVKSYIPCLERGGKRWREVQMWETCVGREARLHTSAEVCAQLPRIPRRTHSAPTWCTNCLKKRHKNSYPRLHAMGRARATRKCLIHIQLGVLLALIYIYLYIDIDIEMCVRARSELRGLSSCEVPLF